MFFLITFGVGFAALNTGNNLLYLVLSLMLAFLVLSGVLSESALRGIAVRRRLPREFFEGAASAVGLEITNAQVRVPAFAIVVADYSVTSDGASRFAGRTFLLRVGPGRTESRAYRFTPARRGDIRFTHFEVSTRFPFGLFAKSLSLDSSQKALVYPAVERIRAIPTDGAAQEVGEIRSAVLGGGSAVSGLRDYTPGDLPRRIHWPASLRSGALQVRDVERERQTEIEVRLRTHGQTPGERFERSVGWAASEVVAFLEAGTRVALRTDATRFAAGEGSGQRARLLSYLARVEPGPAVVADAS